MFWVEFVVALGNYNPILGLHASRVMGLTTVNRNAIATPGEAPSANEQSGVDHVDSTATDDPLLSKHLPVFESLGKFADELRLTPTSRPLSYPSADCL